MIRISDWTTALRSGKYAQGALMLYDAKTNEFCCLGVGCDLINPKFKLRKPELLDVANFVVPLRGELVEMKRDYPLFEAFFAWMNDVGFSFRQIADEIDRLWSGDTVFYSQYLNPDGPDALANLKEQISRGV